MDIERTRTFEQHFRQRAGRKMKRLFHKKLVVFMKNPHDKSLRKHALSHQWAGCWSFSLTDESGQDDFRVIFEETKSGYLFVDFGTHDQVYRPWR